MFVIHSIQNKVKDFLSIPGFLRKVMKITLSFIAFVLIASITSFLITIPRVDEDYGKANYVSSFNGNNLIESFDMAENGTLSILTKEGNVWLTNLDLETAKMDESAKGINRVTMMSQLAIKYVDRDNRTYLGTSYANALDSGRKKPVIEKNGNHIKVTYQFLTGKASEGLYITVPIEYVIKDGCVTVTVINKEIQENEEYKLLEISLLPYLGAASPEDKGYIFIPDGCGALIDYHNLTNPKEFNQLIYGRDPSLKTKMKTEVTQNIWLPVFGIQRGNKAMLAIIDEGDALASVTAQPKGVTSNWSNAFFTFRFREYDTITLNELGWNERSLPFVSKESAKDEIFRVKYYFMDGENANYTEMAKLHKKYLMDKYGLSMLDVTENVPFYATVNMSVRKIKPVLGLPQQVVEPLTTFEELQEMLDTFHGLGIDKMIVEVKGWQAGGPYYKVNDDVKFESKIGGYSGFKKLAKEIGTKKSAELFLYNDFVNGYESGNGFLPMIQGNRDITGALSLQNTYMQSTGTKDIRKSPWYLFTPGYSTGVFLRYMNHYKDLSNEGAHGISVGGYGDTLYADLYNSIVGDIAGRRVSNRQNTLRMWQASLQSARKDLGQLLVSGGNHYSLPFANHIVSAAMYSSQYKYAGRSVPYYQILTSGMVNRASSPVNFSEDINTFYLKCLETGVYPMYSFFAKESSAVKNTRLNHLYNGEYTIWKAEVIENYKKYYDAYKSIGGREIVDHKQIGDETYQTTYGNGVKITVDYHSNTFKVDK